MKLNKTGRHLSKLLFLSFLSCISLWSSAQISTLVNISNPVGVGVDDDGNILASHDEVFSVNISKFANNGVPIGTVPIGGFFDFTLLGRMAKIPSSGQFIYMDNVGRVFAIDPQTLNISPLFNIRELIVDQSRIYDVFSCADPAIPCTVDAFEGNIQTAFSTYGDIAVWETSLYTDLFITGLSQAQTFPFVMRIRLEGNQITEARVLASSRAEAAASGGGSQVRLERGIAVNGNGLVLTSMPNARFNGTSYSGPFDDLVFFPVSFDPQPGSTPPFPPTYGLQDIYSTGMDVDPFGNFYIVTSSIGAPQLGVSGEGALVILANDPNQPLVIGSLGQLTSSFRDVSYSASRHSAYFTASLSTILPGNDGVFEALLDNFIPRATNCAPLGDMLVNQNVIPQGAYYSSNTLFALGRLISNTEATFQAGESVVLLPGFSAEANSDLHVFIQTCAPANQTKGGRQLKKLIVRR